MSVLTPADTGDAPTTADLFALIGGERPSAPMSVPSRDDTHVDLNAAMIAFLESLPPHPPRKLTLQQMRDSLVSANDPYSTSQDNLHPSRVRGEGPEVHSLCADLVAALAARGSRRAMLRPRRRVRRRDLFDSVRFHLRKLSRRALNDRHLRGLPAPSVELLQDALDMYVRRELRHLILGYEPGEQPHPQRVRRTYLDETRRGEGAVHDVALSAATYALANWTPQWIEQRRRWGAKGGPSSKRTATWDDSDLDRLAELEGKTIPEQAAILGRSERTISTMRAALRERQAAILDHDVVPPTPCTPLRRPGRLRAVHRLALHHRPVPDRRRLNRGDLHGPLRPEHDDRGVAQRPQGRRRQTQREPQALGPGRAGPTPGRSGRPHGRSTGRGLGHFSIEHRQDEEGPPRPQRRPSAVTDPGSFQTRTDPNIGTVPTSSGRRCHDHDHSSSTGPPRPLV